MIVAVANIKGGTGKSTISTNLALMRAIDKSDVLLVDTDPQASSMDFSTIREEQNHKPRITSVSVYGKAVYHEVKKFEKKFDDIIIDVEGGDSSSLRGALIIADVIVIPLLASQLDSWTITLMNQLLEDISSEIKDTKIITVLNRVDTNPKTMLTEKAEQFLSKRNTINTNNIKIGDRVVFRKCVAEGLCVIEQTKDTKAISEIKNLYNEVFK